MCCSWLTSRVFQALLCLYQVCLVTFVLGELCALAALKDLDWNSSAYLSLGIERALYAKDYLDHMILVQVYFHFP